MNCYFSISLHILRHHVFYEISRPQEIHVYSAKLENHHGNDGIIERTIENECKFNRKLCYILLIN